MNKLTRGSIVTIVLSLFFSLIMLYVSLSVLEIQQTETFGSALIFLILNILVLLIMSLVGQQIAYGASVAVFAASWLFTAVYTILQFGYMLLYFNFQWESGYFLVQIILFFLYLACLLPTLVLGGRINNNPAGRYHHG